MGKVPADIPIIGPHTAKVPEKLVHVWRVGVVTGKRKKERYIHRGKPKGWEKKKRKIGTGQWFL